MLVLVAQPALLPARGRVGVAAAVAMVTRKPRATSASEKWLTKTFCPPVSGRPGTIFHWWMPWLVIISTCLRPEAKKAVCCSMELMSLVSMPAFISVPSATVRAGPRPAAQEI